MGTVTRMELRKVADLHPYENNAKLHPAEQIEKLRRSFREFGMIVPIGIDSQDRVIYGHGRLLAAQAEGWDEVPTVTVEDLTEEQRAAFVHADNLLGETGYDKNMLKAEAKALQMAGFDVTIIGFDAAGIALNGIEADHFWDGEGEDSEEYQEFVDKFKPKLTTDDCYTPVPVYEAVKAWTIKHYDLAGAEILRPFYPGGDYQAENYPDGCVVIDNPPFSILSDICRWYQENGVRFFLFAPGLTLFSIASGTMNYIPTGVAITYENGASITTSFVTNMGEWKIEICPDLYEAVDNAVETFLAGSKFTPPSMCTLTASPVCKSTSSRSTDKHFSLERTRSPSREPWTRSARPARLSSAQDFSYRITRQKERWMPKAPQLRELRRTSGGSPA